MTRFQDKSFSVPMPSKAKFWPKEWEKHPEMREMYEERAAIMEFCGNLPREQAERNAHAELEGYLAKIEAHQKREKSSPAAKSNHRKEDTR